MLQAIADIWSGQEERLLPCQPSVSIVHAFKFNALSVQVRILSMGWAYAHICARAYVHTCMHGCMYMYRAAARQQRADAQRDMLLDGKGTALFTSSVAEASDDLRCSFDVSLITAAVAGFVTNSHALGMYIVSGCVR